jgi:DNA mismatch endonuclease (patch repair protein)
LADIFTATERSAIMSRIRSKGTALETRLYEIIRKCLGRRRRIDRNVPGLPGHPDIVVPSLHLAIFADGCFYHSCPKHGHKPKSNKGYWIPKLIRNRRRDKKNRAALRKLGYRVWIVWEHSLKGTKLENSGKKLSQRLRAALIEKRSRARIKSFPVHA